MWVESMPSAYVWTARSPGSQPPALKGSFSTIGSLKSGNRNKRTHLDMIVMGLRRALEWFRDSLFEPGRQSEDGRIAGKSWSSISPTNSCELFLGPAGVDSTTTTSSVVHESRKTVKVRATLQIEQ